MCVCVWGGEGGGGGRERCGVFIIIGLCNFVLCNLMSLYACCTGAGEHVCIYTPPCCIFLVNDSESVM